MGVYTYLYMPNERILKKDCWSTCLKNIRDSYGSDRDSDWKTNIFDRSVKGHGQFIWLNLRFVSVTCTCTSTAGRRKQKIDSTSWIQQSIPPPPPLNSLTPIWPVTKTLIHDRALQFHSVHLATDKIATAVDEAQIRRLVQIVVLEGGISAPADAASLKANVPGAPTDVRQVASDQIH